MRLKTVVKVCMLAVGVTVITTGGAAAQAYPAKPVRLIVPFPPGGGVDFIGRIIGKGLSERLGQQVTVDNRPGANAILGLEILKNAPPDGYTIAAASAGPLTVNPHIYRKLAYDTLRDFTPISNMVNFPLLLVAHPSLPVKNVRDLIALAKARPGEITYSSPGSGNSGHLTAALFDSMAKIKTVHVPYKGTAPAVVAVLSGETQLTWSSIPTILPHVRSGRVRALGVGNKERLAALPEFPTIAESGVPGYEGYAWGGMIGPANMQKDIVARLNKEIGVVLGQKDVIDNMLAQGTVPTPSTPEEFTAYMKSELKKWGDVVKLAKIQAE
ncbi:MAG: tripartite tricarboxylate transporter substrate binding protein [Betaproteobacteria bacterium]|jgi:tripartite-type tricarboxylate transporter receptor subunit TctC|nr:tripartite tricarboxylate transporter substrate binding protein [Betaproteobacteria bacterium]